MIPVVKPHMPNREKLNKYLDVIFEREWLTNNGVLVQELTRRLEKYLEVENLLLVANGTLALQIAYRTLGVSRSKFDTQTEAITTPFSFVATASSLVWEGVEPVFVDIDSHSWCLDPKNIEKAITSKTRAIVPVHVFGNPCDIDAIEAIANKHKIKVVYDASHAFSVKYKGKSILNYGDAATLSFHATKLFHTAEGGAIAFKHKSDLKRAKKMINFGAEETGSIKGLGINAKMSELHAAIGLCILDEMEVNLYKRKNAWEIYKNMLDAKLKLQVIREGCQYNYSYFPVLFESEKKLIKANEKLKENSIYARRYFCPSLDEMKFLQEKSSCEISRDIACRILCLPIFTSLERKDQIKVVDVIENL